MSFVQVWIHAVWSTKRREPVLTEGVLAQVIDHIKTNSKEKGFYILELNGFADHLHCLMALRSDWSVAKQMQMIKGEAANWINKGQIFKSHFEWADEYFAASVSKDKLDVVRAYIINQQVYHKKESFKEEYDNFLEKFGFGQG
jgi:putative transposase